MSNVYTTQYTTVKTPMFSKCFIRVTVKHLIVIQYKAHIQIPHIPLCILNNGSGAMPRIFKHRFIHTVSHTSYQNMYIHKNCFTKFKILKSMVKIIFYLQTKYQIISGTQHIQQSQNSQLPTVQIYLAGPGIWDSVQMNGLLLC